MQKLLQLSALKATKTFLFSFFYKMQLCNFWPDSELLIAWLRWNGWVTNWLCRKRILSKNVGQLHSKLEPIHIDIDTFLAKRSRIDLILGHLLPLWLKKNLFSSIIPHKHWPFQFNSDEVITFVCSAIDAKYR